MDASYTRSLEAADVRNNQLRAVGMLHTVMESGHPNSKKKMIDDLLCASGLESCLSVDTVLGSNVAVEDIAVESIKDAIHDKSKNMLKSVATHMASTMTRFKEATEKHLFGLKSDLEHVSSDTWEKVRKTTALAKAHPIKTIMAIVGIVAAGAVALPMLKELPGINAGMSGLNTFVTRIYNTLEKIPLLGSGMKWTLTKVKGFPRIKFPSVQAGFVKILGPETAAKLGYNFNIFKRVIFELTRVTRVIGVVLSNIGQLIGRLINIYLTKFVHPLYKGSGQVAEYAMARTGSATIGVAAGGFVWGWITALNACILGTVGWFVTKLFLNAVKTIRESLISVGIIHPSSPSDFAGGAPDDDEF